jgi:hypothetical protein
VPSALRAQAEYVFNWIVCDRFGLPVPIIKSHEAGEIVLTQLDAEGCLSSPSVGGWGPSGSGRYCTSPSPPAAMDVSLSRGDPALAVLFGRPGYALDGKALELSFDPWGTIFWCLARVEELETDLRDRHGRFAATQSYLARYDLLQRPIVDEYVEFLWQCLLVLWPGMSRKAEISSVLVTCDVDVPYSRSLKGAKALARGVAGGLLRRSPSAALNTVRNAWRVKRHRDYSLDPNNSFSWIMDRCEEQGLHAAFYFIAGNHPVDPRYDLGEPFVLDLLGEISRRGHEIGMHGSYVTYRDPSAMASEFTHLRSVCDSLGIRRDYWGNRQHYLRWDMCTTPDALADAGFNYDTSLSFADRAGFRCGTCHDFPLWSWSRRTGLALREQPLIVMEATVFDRGYMGLGREAGLDFIFSLKRLCRRYGGTFVLLWHNSSFPHPVDREIYAEILKQ